MSAGRTVTTVTAQPVAEYHDDLGDVIWWRGMPPTESPWVGNPYDLGHTIELRTQDGLEPRIASSCQIGGWPGDGYFTHFSMIPEPSLP